MAGMEEELVMTEAEYHLRRNWILTHAFLTWDRDPDKVRKELLEELDRQYSELQVDLKGVTI